MATFSGTYRDGLVQLDSPLDLPDGFRVPRSWCRRIKETACPELQYGLDEATWVDTPENRAAILARMEAYEPPVMTPEEEAEWNAAREAVKQYTMRK